MIITLPCLDSSELCLLLQLEVATSHAYLHGATGITSIKYQLRCVEGDAPGGGLISFKSICLSKIFMKMVSFYRKKFKKPKKWTALKVEDRELIKNGCLTSILVEPEKLGMVT